MVLVTALTPQRLRTASSAVVFWNCQATSSDSVTHPLCTATSTTPLGIAVFHEMESSALSDLVVPTRRIPCKAHLNLIGHRENSSECLRRLLSSDFLCVGPHMPT